MTAVLRKFPIRLRIYLLLILVALGFGLTAWTSVAAGADDGLSRVLTVNAVVVLVIAVFGALLARSVATPLTALSAKLGSMTSGTVDLATRFDATGTDELARLAGGLNQLLESVHKVVREVALSNGNLASSAQALAGATTSAQQGMKQQQADTEHLAAAMNQMVATVQEVARNAQTAADATRQAETQTGTGRRAVENTMGAIESLAEELTHSRQIVQKLADDSNSIGTVLDVINGVAEQTNLLALNAAIEAARAGEQGRGFAVVADEVRTLAQRTQASTKEIQDIIERLQAGAQNAVASMADNADKAARTVEESAKAGDTFNAITAAVGTVNDMNTQIASAAEEQAATAEEINRNVIAIRDVATRTSQGVAGTKAAAEELNGMADRLRELLKKLKV